MKSSTINIKGNSMPKHQIVMLIVAVIAWTTIAVVEWVPRYPAFPDVAPMPADGSAPPLPPPIEVGSGIVRR